jgi:hypothetical protein
MSKDNQNKANEPLSQYGQPATFEQVRKMFQETNKQFQEIERNFKETGERFKETDKQFKESERLLTERFKETDRKIDKLAKMYGGISENSRDVAEEFFRRGLESRSSLYGIRYDRVGRMQNKTKKLQGEYDIVLYNGDTIIVIEVKYKLHPNDVEDFIARKLPNFKLLFPEYKDKKVIGGMAGMSVPNHAFELAEKQGLLVLTQSGDNIAVMNAEGADLQLF